MMKAVNTINTAIGHEVDFHPSLWKVDKANYLQHTKYFVQYTAKLSDNLIKAAI